MAGVALLPPLVQNFGLITNTFPLYNNNNNNDENNNATLEQQQRYLEETIVEVSNRKQSVTTQYLNLIESSVDRFLTQVVGVDVNALGERYLDEAPSPRNMQILRRNIDLLATTAQDAFLPTSELNTMLITPLVQQVYRDFLTPLRNFIEENYRRLRPIFEQLLSTTSSSNQQQQDQQQRNQNLQRLQNRINDMRDDVIHIEKMWQLDQTSVRDIDPASGLSHVVPVNGMALGRVHRLHAEMTSCVEHHSR